MTVLTLASLVTYSLCEGSLAHAVNHQHVTARCSKRGQR